MVYEGFKDLKKTGLYGHVYDFSFDFDKIGVYDMLDIHKYLMIYTVGAG